MKHTFVSLFRQLHRILTAMGYVLARVYRLCHRIQFSGIGISLIPELITCNISFRAGKSGRAYHLPFFLKTKLKYHRDKETALTCIVPLVAPPDIQGCAP